MTSEFTPKIESRSSQNEEIGELKNVAFFSDGNFDDSSVKRTEILDFKDEGYLLHNLITKEECKHYIQQGEEIGFRSIYGVKDSVRSQQRIIFRSSELAKLLWRRLEPFLSELTIDGDPTQHHVHGIEFLLQGTWQPYALNDMFRLCRYLPTGHFSPHFDGHFSQSSTERSLKTFMLYLNEDFTGGSTNFIDEKQTLYMDETGKYCAEDTNVICRIQPETGMAIVFNHHRLHEGQKIGDGQKYILRTDIMFRNTSDNKQSAADEKALGLVQEAERLEASGDCMEAADLYRRAFKMSPKLAEAYGN